MLDSLISESETSIMCGSRRLRRRYRRYPRTGLRHRATERPLQSAVRDGVSLPDCERMDPQAGSRPISRRNFPRIVSMRSMLSREFIFAAYRLHAIGHCR